MDHEKHSYFRRMGLVSMAALILMTIASPGAAEMAQSMKHQLDEMFLWKNRVIVITAPSDRDAVRHQNIWDY